MPSSTARSTISSTSMPIRRVFSLIGTECSVNPPEVVQYEKRAAFAPCRRWLRCFFDREAVDDRLKLRSPADDGAFRRAVLSCLVIGHPQNLRPGLALDQIDRAAKHESTVDRDRILEAGWIVSGLPGQAERELEQPRLPFGIRRKLIDPHAEIGSQARDLVLPDAIDRRREALGVFRRDARERVVQRLQDAISLSRVDGELRLLQARGRTRPGPDETGSPSSAGPCAAAAPALRAAPDDTQPTGRTGTGMPRTAASADTEYGRAFRRWFCRNGRVASVTRTRPSNCDHSFRARAQRSVTDRFRQSFNVSM